jgi:hypothetical protein
MYSIYKIEHKCYLPSKKEFTMRTLSSLLCAAALLVHCSCAAASVKKDLDPTPYILPETHPLKKLLDVAFQNPRSVENERNFTETGFETLFIRNNGLRVARHPLVPGYLFKLHFEADATGPRMHAFQQKLIQRCISASHIRERIKRDNFQYFTVPDKWLYRPPTKNIFVLVVTDMKLASKEDSIAAWKTKITKKHLQELYHLMNDGFASPQVYKNVAYTTNGTFSCIDTESKKRTNLFHKVDQYLSRDMRKKWNKLVKKSRKDSEKVVVR